MLVLILAYSKTVLAVEAVVSYTVFHKYAKNGADSSYVDVYWQVNPSSLRYQKNADSTLVAQIKTEINITNGGKSIVEYKYLLNTTPRKAGENNSIIILEVKRYALPPGKNVFQLSLAQEAFPEKAFRRTDTIVVERSTSTSLSSIQLIDTFFAKKGNDAFYKNNMLHIPRPLNFYDEGQRLIHCYVEQYNLIDTPGSFYIQHLYIGKNAGDFAISKLQKIDTITTANMLQKRYYTFDMSAYGSGNYTLNARLKDAQGNTIDKKDLFFQTINKKPLVIKEKKTTDTTIRADGDITFDGTYFELGKTFVAKYNIKQLMAILRMIRPLADPSETIAIENFLKRPEELYMRYFIYNYFAKENKEKPEAEWEKFSTRIRQINREFSAGGTPGYETDRGIRYIRYGKPDEVLRVVNEPGAQPYEIWRYNNIGSTSQQGTFIFYQPAMAMGDYRYLTSNVTGEMRNNAWRSILYINGQPSGERASRAEQYLEGK